MIDPRNQSTVANLVLYGFITMIVGIGIFMLLTMVGAFVGGPGTSLLSALGIVIAVTGVGMMFWGVIRGTNSVKSVQTAAKDQRHCHIVARFATNHLGEMIFNPESEEPEDIRGLFVQVEFDDGKRAEFRCVPPVWDSAGEGMKGIATFEGDWLGSFLPDPRKLDR